MDLCIVEVTLLFFKIMYTIFVRCIRNFFLNVDYADCFLL